MTDSPTPSDRLQDGKVHSAQPDFHWREIFLGFGLSLTITLLVGIPLTFSFGTSWAFAWTGTASIFISAIVVARLAKTGELLNGAMLSVLYFATVAMVYLGGQTLELLPDPLPGLPADDSTFFFVWPLAQIIAGTLGSFIGGLGWGVRRRG